MEGCSRNKQLFKKESCFAEDNKLELSLAPPGDQDWSFNTNNNKIDESAFSSFGRNQHSSFLQLSNTAGNLHASKNKPFSFSTASASANTAVPSSSSPKRTAPAPVVGWPPIRSFRKNLACSSSLKQAPESQKANSSKTANDTLENSKKSMFVKINMDGVPIGRKVDLNAYDSYAKLSSAVDELFRGLLAVQRDSSADGNQNQQENKKLITGLLDGSGEYTLVYEDNEGDKMLVGDVPWHMFVSTVKRLRVLKSSDVSALNRKLHGKFRHI